MNLKIILSLILCISFFFIMGCVEQNPSDESNAFINKIANDNTNPSDLISKLNLPGNLELFSENHQNGTYINAIDYNSALYRSKDKESFANIIVTKYLDESSAKENYNLMVRNFIDGFELGSDSIIQKTQSIEINSIPIEKYSTVILGIDEGITVNIYVWQVENYAFLVSGGSTDYNGDISLDLTEQVFEHHY